MHHCPPRSDERLHEQRSVGRYRSDLDDLVMSSETGGLGVDDHEALAEQLDEPAPRGVKQRGSARGGGTNDHAERATLWLLVW